MAIGQIHRVQSIVTVNETHAEQKHEKNRFYFRNVVRERIIKKRSIINNRFDCFQKNSWKKMSKCVWIYFISFHLQYRIFIIMTNWDFAGVLFIVTNVDSLVFFHWEYILLFIELNWIVLIVRNLSICIVWLIQDSSFILVNLNYR